MELKIIVKNTFSMASTKVIQMLTGILRAKINALFLGTEGMGIVSQVLYSATMFSKFTMLGMNDGIVKQISSSGDEVNVKDQIMNSVKSYSMLVSFVVVLVTIAAFVFADELSVYFFGNEKYFDYYLICVVSFPILILNSTSFALLKSFKKVKEIAKAELYSALLSFIIYIPIVMIFGLGGAIFVTILTFVIRFYFNHFHSRKVVLNQFNLSYFEILKRGKIVKRDLKELVIFGGYGLTIGFYEIFVEVVSRSIVVKELGIAKLGLYAPLQAWGGIFSGLMLPTIFTYLYPRFSEAKNNYSDINAILNDVFRLVTFASIPFLFIGISFKSLIIPLFYSYEFVGATDYLAGHFLGVLFLLWMYTFTQVFTPIGKITVYTGFLFAMHSMKIGIVYLTIPQYGLYGWMLVFSLPPLVFFVVFNLYLRNLIQFNLHGRNLSIMIYAIGGSLILEFMTNEYIPEVAYFLSVVFILITIAFLSQKERNVITSKILSTFRMKNQ